MSRNVVLAGWGQITQTKEQEENLLDPMGLMREAAGRAADAAGNHDALRHVDGVMVSRILSAHYEDAAAQLAEELAAAPRLKHVSKVGGNTPQLLVNKAAGMIARGELDSVLITGAETFYPRTGSPSPGLQGAMNLDRISDDMIGSTEAEMQHGLFLPVHGFPLYETAFWAESGLHRDRYLNGVAAFWAEFSKVAAENPYAWSRKALSASEIATQTHENRVICFPYTKFMTSLLTADLGAALLLVSEEKARTLGRTGRNTVYFRGGGYAQDPQRFFIQKTNYTTSPPLRAAVDKALKRSGVSLAEIQCFDLYSCFPCAVTMARRMLGLSSEDPRPQTLTGGLGFFGAPANNYSTHAIATLAERISTGKVENGLVTGLGWFMHKHSAGVYSSRPGDSALERFDTEDDKNFLAGNDPIPSDPEPTGSGVVETYTVVYGRDGSPQYAVIYGKTERGLRFVANTPSDADTFDALCRENRVGGNVRLSHDARSQRNVAELVG